MKFKVGTAAPIQDGVHSADGEIENNEDQDGFYESSSSSDKESEADVDESSASQTSTMSLGSIAIIQNATEATSAAKQRRKLRKQKRLRYLLKSKCQRKLDGQSRS